MQQNEALSERAISAEVDHRVGEIGHLQAIRARDQQFDAVFGHTPKHGIVPEMTIHPMGPYMRG
jgi:hypothetical protein